MSRRLLFLVLALSFAGSVSSTSASAAARFYMPSYGASPEKIAGFDLGGDGALTPIPGSPFTAVEPGGGGLVDLAFNPDGSRALSGLLFTKGIQPYRVPASGVFETAGALATASATAVAISPDGRYAYEATRDFMGVPAEGIKRFTINPDGSLSVLDPSAPVGGDATDVAITPDGRFLFAATGSAIVRFAVGANGSLSPLGSTPAAGAALLATSTDERFLNVLIDSGGNSGVATFGIGADGGLSKVGTTVDLGTTSSHIFAVAPDGRHVFVPDRNHDLILTVAIAADGTPSALPGGMAVPTPEGVGVSPSGNQLVFYRGGGSDNAVGAASIGPDGALTRLPFESPWDTVEPEPLVFQPHPTPVARAVIEEVPQGLTYRFNATGSERAASYAWDFGDGRGLTSASPSATHSYDKAGVYLVTLTVTDASGCSTKHVYNGQSTVCPGGSVATTSFSVDTPPVLSRPRAVPKKFVPKPKGKAKGKFGTTFRFSVNEAATVRFKFERKKIGRLVGGRCKPKTSKNAARKECPIFRPLGSRSRQAKAGSNRLKWNGRLKGKPLAAGSYRATVVATDKAGGRSVPQTVGFRVLPLPRKP